MLDCYMLSVKGPHGVNNDDYAFIDSAKGIFVVADGIGGRPGGALASQVAVRSFVSAITCADGAQRLNPCSLQHAITVANQSVRGIPQNDPLLEGLGTTLSAVVLNGPLGQIVHVGDSRVYLFRDNRLTQLTSDHTVTAELVERGHLSAEGAKHHPLRNMLSRSIGYADEVSPDVDEVNLLDCDWLILATDGLTKALEMEAFARVLRESEGKDAEGVCRTIMNAALEHTPSDDVTTVVTQFLEVQK